MKTIGVLTSGGDAPGMNAAIRAVVRIGIDKGFRVMGIERGFNGLLNGEIYEMDRSSVADIIQRGGTMLRTARCEEFKNPEVREKAAKILKVFGIHGLVVIGGNGSFMGAQRMSELGFPSIGIPGTIDNDLAYTDYAIGFDTAVNTVLDAVNKIRDTSTSHERVSIIEVMGRHCGDIALYAGLAGGGESIIVPEVEYDVDEVCKTILEGKLRGKLHSIIILAEGVGNAAELAKSIEQTSGLEARATILGHIQRGGSPTAFDRILASKLGARAVELLAEDSSSRVVGVHGSDVIDMDINEAVNMKKDIDHDLLNLARILSK